MSHVIEITDFNASELDVYARLTENQLINRHEPEKGLFIAESPKVIERALDGGYEPVSLLMERRHVEGEARDIIKRCGDIPVYTAEFDVLTQLTGFQLTRGVLCAMRRVKRPTVEAVCAGARRIAVLENVMNPTNIGAIFRSAAALNMDAVLLTPACSDPLYRRAARVSMGTVFQVPWTYLGKQVFDVKCVTNTPEGGTHKFKARMADCDDGIDLQNGENAKSAAIEWTVSGIELLHKLGFKTAAMALNDKSISIADPSLMAEEKLAIVLGTEGNGLADKTIADCDYTVRIPMSHGVDSLNVAAASAIAFWQLGVR